MGRGQNYIERQNGTLVGASEPRTDGFYLQHSRNSKSFDEKIFVNLYY